MNKFLQVIKVYLIVFGLIGVAYSDTYSTEDILKGLKGAYLGADVGGSFNNVKLQSQQVAFANLDGTYNINSDFSSFMSGIQIGYLHEFSKHLVFGVDANIIFNINQTDNLNINCDFNSNVFDRFIFSNKMQGSVKGRGGHFVKWNDKLFLPYLTAGASLANVGLQYKNDVSDYYSKNINQFGWLIGTGIEWFFKQNLSLRTEYSYVNYGNTIEMNIPTIYGLTDSYGNARAKLSSNNIYLSINYWI